MGETTVLGRAAELGLELRVDSAHGTLDGCPVSIHHQILGGEGSSYVVRGAIDPPLDLGLDAHRRAFSTPSFGHVAVGHPDLDGEFDITGDEAARIQALFTPELRGELAALHRGAFDLRLDDAGCRIYGREGFFLPDGAWAERALRGVSRIVSLVNAARAHLPPAGALGTPGAALAALSQARGLRYASAPLHVIGEVEGRAVEITSTRTGRRRHHLVARALFEADLGLGLALHRQSLLDELRTLLGGQDVIVGDAPFDKRFLIRADPERAERVGLLLDAETRAALLALDARAGAVKVDDEGVTVDPVRLDGAPEDAAWMVDVLVEITGRVSRNAVRGGAEAGPYR